jgi:hypothetical protein
VKTSLCLAVVAALAALLFHPLGTALPYADDFFFITLVRQLEEPWRLLTQDSLGLYFFRPVVMYFWWITDALFGDHYAAHYAANVAVHLGCATALFALARSLSISTALAAISAIAFAVHPTPVSATAWLSDRFDLFAALFGLVSLIGVQRLLTRGSTAWAAGAVVAAFAAMLSKETGFAFPVIGLLMLAWVEPRDAAAPAKARFRLGIALVATALAALALRTMALRSGGDALFFGGGLLAALANGTLKWLRFLPDFVVAEAGSVAAVCVWLAALMILLVAALQAAWRGAYDRGLARTVVIGLALMLLVALAQSPVVGASGIFAYHLAGRPEGSVLFDWVVSNRYYYLSLAGFFLVLGALAEGVRHSIIARGVRRAAVASSVVAAVAIVALLTGARAAGRDWSRFTRTQDAALIAAGIEAFGGSHKWPAGCKIFLLGTPAYSKNYLYGADTIVKYALPRGHSLMGCLVQTEVAPWFHIAEHRKLGSVEPLEVITSRGRPYPPLQVGNLAIYYLRIPDSDAVRQDLSSRFFEFDGQRFVEVTEAVRDGRRPVRFYDNRPPG